MTDKISNLNADEKNKAANDYKESRMDGGWSSRVTEKIIQTNDEEELRRRGYLLGKTLGEGSYAKVKAGYDQNAKRKCALKIVNRRKAPKEFQNKFLPRELAVLKKVKHENIVLLYEIIVFGDKIVMVLELAGHGDLLEYIKLRGALDERRSRRLVVQITAAIEYLHTRNIVHRDLKCENILLDRHNNVKVSDFGFSKDLMVGGAPSCTFCGSSAYASPEILQGKPYCAKASDMWSLGVILYIMACGKMPFDDSSIKRLIKDQLGQRIEWPNEGQQPSLTNQLKTLIRWMLQPVVSRRATVIDVKHSFWLVLGQMDGYKETGNSDKQPAENQRQLQESCLSSGADEKKKTPQRDKTTTSEKAKLGRGNLTGEDTPPSRMGRKTPTLKRPPTTTAETAGKDATSTTMNTSRLLKTFNRKITAT